MSLSTDKRAATVLAGTMPETISPMFGRDAKQERDELKHTYPEYIPGKRVVIPDSDRDDYLYCQAAESYFKAQYELFQNRMRYHLGDAEYGTDSEGNVFVSRRFGFREGYNVTGGPTDSIVKERG